MPTRTRHRSHPVAGTRSGHRTDLSGLAAVALLPLLVAAIIPGVLPGGAAGVDVLFVLSGFLVTSVLVSEWTRAGRITLLTCYARYARRLLPAAALVMAATGPLILTCLPRSSWPDAGWDLLTGGLAVLNWRRAAQDAAVPTVPDAAAGVLAHYWTLGVAGQVLLLWPPLLAGAAAWAFHRRHHDPRRAPLLVAGLLTAGSLAWAVGASGAPAVFGTHTRLWELTLGGGLALVALRPVGLPRSVAAVLGWGGLAAVTATVFLHRPESAGLAALPPALGTAAIIVAATARTGPSGAGPAGTPTTGAGPVRILATRPLRAVGRHCYPLYLWYWPLLVAAHARFGEVPVVAGLGVLGAAALLAVITHRYVEAPVRARVRGWSPAETLRTAALLPAAAVIGGLLLQLGVWPPRQPHPQPVAGTAPAAPTPSPAPAPGAAALGRSPAESPAGRPVARVRSITPEPVDAGRDLPNVYRHNCFSTGPDAPARACVYGDRGSRFTVALAGDDQAANWVPALQAVAQAQGWRLITYLREDCPFLDVAVAGPGGGRLDACARWYANVRTELTRTERPQLLLTTSRRYPLTSGGKILSGDAAHKAFVAGMRRTWSGLVAARVATVVLRDTPVPGVDVAACVSANPTRLTRCATPRRTALDASAGAAQAEAVRTLTAVPLIDLNSAICPASRCAPVIGGVLVYRDTRHLTATYARTLAPRLASALERIRGETAP